VEPWPGQRIVVRDPTAPVPAEVGTYSLSYCPQDGYSYNLVKCPWCSNIIGFKIVSTGSCAPAFLTALGTCALFYGKIFNPLVARTGTATAPIEIELDSQEELAPSASSDAAASDAVLAAIASSPNESLPAEPNTAVDVFRPDSTERKRKRSGEFQTG
jgi:hypothetical protein